MWKIIADSGVLPTLPCASKVWAVPSCQCHHHQNGRSAPQEVCITNENTNTNTKRNTNTMSPSPKWSICPTKGLYYIYIYEEDDDDDDEALTISPKSASQEVKKIVLQIQI